MLFRRKSRARLSGGFGIGGLWVRNLFSTKNLSCIDDCLLGLLRHTTGLMEKKLDCGGGGVVGSGVALVIRQRSSRKLNIHERSVPQHLELTVPEPVVNAKIR
ncbi:hypothetical protein AVEN_217094-1 [Araneus ventricosus]|uniref:Uncharacterized protein n=1 Tax=Araneus ventricosus TaxID=182803 RepID=A0A4Y2NWZ7_ARAVE|nr:hypothetical protein AVEN_217094-1 [Araneus ventricosus]